MREELIRIVDAAMAESARRSGPRLACRVGCTQCCMGPFPIGASDADRLRRGLAGLEADDPPRAARVLARARRYGAADDEPCPALDPETGACDLYLWRPLTCRVFGPPVRWGSGAIGMCELCFEGVGDAEIAACAVEIPAAPPEEAEETSVAHALTASL